MTAVPERVRERFVRTAGRHPDPDGLLRRLVEEEAPLLTEDERDALFRPLRAELLGLGVLEHLLADEATTDVLVNGPGEVWVERHGTLAPTGVRIDREGIDRAIERLVAPLGLRADRSAPIVDGRLPDGSRVTVVLPPLAVDGPVVAIRRHRARRVPLDSFTTPEVAGLLRTCVADGRNLVVFGGTGSGKTTLLNALTAHLGPHERVVTIEDTAELRLPHPHVVRLESRPANAEGVGGVAIRSLVRAALRLRPDRIIVGEVRGGEALDMVWALGTGHDGSLSTLHASTALDALLRLETLALCAEVDLPPAAIRMQVGAAVDVLVGVVRRVGGAREVATVCEVDPDRELAVRVLAEGGRLLAEPRRPPRRCHG